MYGKGDGLSERKKKILRAIIDAHIDRGEAEIIPAYGQKSVSIRVEITDNGKVAELERNTR